MNYRVVLTAFVVTFCASITFADTFTNKRTGQVLTGYAVGKKINSRSMVKTLEKGFQRLKLSLWDVQYDENGREPIAIVIPINRKLEYSIENKAIIDAIQASLSKGVMFILLEINASGGSIGMALELGSAVSKASDYTPVYGYITTGDSLGAINAGVIPAIACDKLYMHPDAKIGGLDQTDANDPNADTDYKYFDMRKALGKNVGEKMTSVYRGYISSLANETGKPELIATAMVDPEVEVIQIDSDEKLYVEPINLKADQASKKVWSQKGKMLIMNVNEASQAGIIKGSANSREQAVKLLAGKDIQIQVEKSHIETLQKLDSVIEKLDKIAEGIESNHKRIKKGDGRVKKMATRNLIRLYKQIYQLAVQNPDLGINAQYMKMEIDGLEMQFNAMR